MFAVTLFQCRKPTEQVIDVSVFIVLLGVGHSSVHPKEPSHVHEQKFKSHFVAECCCLILVAILTTRGDGLTCRFSALWNGDDHFLVLLQKESQSLCFTPACRETTPVRSVQFYKRISFVLNHRSWGRGKQRSDGTWRSRMENWKLILSCRNKKSTVPWRRQQCFQDFPIKLHYSPFNSETIQFYSCEGEIYVWKVWMVWWFWRFVFLSPPTTPVFYAFVFVLLPTYRFSCQYVSDLSQPSMDVTFLPHPTVVAKSRVFGVFLVFLWIWF